MIPQNEDLTSLEIAGTASSQRIGPYRLIREIGRGGMGTVYLAVRSDDVFQKRVAIKILRARHRTLRAIVRRFRNERQILASLEHPNIARLLDGGTTDEGSPYFVMEYVEGQLDLGLLRRARAGTSARLRAVPQVCAAVQYAHQNLVVHRDIKPANVLVTSDGTPKLLDFGIAKLLEPGARRTDARADRRPACTLMTPEYASPEQVRGEPVTTATDVYSLGVLLYELLTGQPPYRLESRAPAEVVHVVCESLPVRPSTSSRQSAYVPDTDVAVTGPADGTADSLRLTPRPHTNVDTERLRRRLAGDLDTIVLKALSKEPSRRYASVDQFSEDIYRHLRGHPVLARKDTLGYRTSKFVQRNHAAVARRDPDPGDAGGGHHRHRLASSSRPGGTRACGAALRRRAKAGEYGAVRAARCDS